jgi:MoaA/NifB/PqqE/SkfB family radical SAM enzyme
MRLRFPYKLTFIVTYRCNLRCSMCKIWQRGAHPELSLEEIESFFSKSNRFNWVNLSGGEIFLRDDLVEIIGIIAKNCRRLYMLDFPTNGFLTERILESVRQILKIPRLPRKVFITVSLDGPSYLHDRIRGQVRSWQQAVETFRGLRRIGDRRLAVFFGMTLSRDNVSKIDETVEELRGRLPDLDYRDLHVNLLHYSAHYYQNDPSGMADGADLKKYLHTFLKKRGQLFGPVGYLERRYQKMAEKFIDTQKTPLPCKALSGSCFIDPQGDVFACSVMGENLGNIRDYGYDLAKMWQSQAARDLRSRINKGFCPQCWTPCEAYQTILGNIF